MIAEPKLTVRAPIRWLGCVCCTPEDVTSLLLLIPEDIEIAIELRLTLDESISRAEQLNRMDKQGGVHGAN